MKKIISGKTLLIFIVVCLAFGWNFTFSQDPPEKKKQEEITAQSYTVFPAASDIKVDGDMDELAWEQAAVIYLAYEWLPGDNIPGTVNTDL